MKNVNELFIHGVMLDSGIVVHVQFVIILVELWEVWSQELMCLCSKTTTVLSEWAVPRSMDVNIYIIQIRSDSWGGLWLMYIQH